MTESLNHYRRQAKILKKAAAAGEGEALARVEAVLGAGAPPNHSGALHVIACEAGYASWPKLKFALEAAEADEAALAEALKQALFNGVQWRVEQILDLAPDLPDRHFGLLCALYRADGVRRWLARDPEIVHRKQMGPRVPILHLAFSRHLQAHPDKEDAMLAVAEALLAAGADVNAGFPAEPGIPHLLPALYGAVGHAGNLTLGSLLLARGADPNDGESLYHATELGDLRGLRMLLEAGADPKGTNALLRALDCDDAEAVALLLAYGADADEYNADPIGGEEPWVMPALHQAARRQCSLRTVKLLLDHGAEMGRLHGGTTPYAFARVHGHRELAQAISARGGPAELSAAEALLAAAAGGTLPPGARLSGANVPPPYRCLIRDLLRPGCNPDHLENLVALGLDPDAQDREGMTALHTAGWEGLPQVMEYLMTLAPGLGHINGYGGDLLSTILHGAQNSSGGAGRDHAACLALALEVGLVPDRNQFEAAASPAILQVLEDWAAARPELQP